MIKFTTIEHFLTEEHRKYVFPLLFDYFYLKNQKTRSKFILESVLENADLAIVPIDIGYFFKTDKQAMLFTFINQARALNIPVWVYSAGDFGITLQEDVVTFRMSGFDSRLDSQTFVMPSFVSDPYGPILDNEWHPLHKDVLPTLGFVGNADGSFFKRAKELLIHLKQSWQRIFGKDYNDKQPFFPSSSVRYNLLKTLEKSAAVKTDFIFRKKYRAGATTNLDRKTSTEVFFNNIEKNLYTFCLRGSGNFSVRFYETLMMGRIPLLINTDCRLPLNDFIDWNKHCIIASEKNYIEQLVAFHTAKSEKEIIEIQQSNRELVLTCLNRVDYFIKVADLLFQNKTSKVEQ